MLRTLAAVAALLLAAAPAAAGSNRSELELDRMQGTEYPTAQTRRGTTSDLVSIYAAAGVDLAVVDGDQEIAPLSADCITNAELDALAEAHRGSPVGPGDCSAAGEACGRYYVYGIVVAHFAANSPDDCRTGVLGRMWDSEQRSAFAIYYATTTISTDGQKYLRTTAHELGHAFNLHHEDGDGKTTIMNQTSVVGDNFTYDFSEHSTNHLDAHLDRCNRPGTGAFYGVDEEHAGWHASTHLACPAEGSGEGGGAEDER